MMHQWASSGSPFCREMAIMNMPYLAGYYQGTFSVTASSLQADHEGLELSNICASQTVCEADESSYSQF